jgi:hypothetical protein
MKKILSFGLLSMKLGMLALSPFGMEVVWL